MCEGKTRGRLISSEVLFTAVGIVVAYWFDFGMSFVGGPIAWRLPIAMQIVFAIFVIIFGIWSARVSPLAHEPRPGEGSH